MTYNSGSLTSATPASALIAIMDATITAITGLSKVSAAIVVGTNTWNVYKSAAANNSFGSDFYFALGYNTTTPTFVLMTVFEGWNSGTNLASNFAPNSTQIPVVTTWANPNAAAALPSTGTTMAFLSCSTALTTTAFSYFYSVTNDRLVFGWFSSAAQEGFYLGLYDSFQTVANDPFPLCALRFGTGFGNAMTTAATTLAGLATREPRQTVSTAINFGVGATGAASSCWTLNNSTNAEIYSAFPFVSRVLLQGRASGAYRGLLKDIYIGPIQINNGDTITWSLAGTPHTAVRIFGATFGVYVDEL